MLKFSLTIALVLLSSNVNAQAANGGERGGVTNPAYENCIKLGGAVNEVHTPGGDTPFCLIDQWKLFQQMNARNTLKPHRYGQSSVPNPAAANCLDIGGALSYQSTPAGDVGYCNVDAWKLLRAINILKP